MHLVENMWKLLMVTQMSHGSVLKVSRMSADATKLAKVQ